MPQKTLTLLEETPPRLAALTENRSAAQLWMRPAPDAWSAVEIVAHLRACADVWGDCIASILAEDHPTIRAIDPRAWIKQTDYPELDFETSLDAFAKQRTALLAMLQPRTAAEWARAATVTGAGGPLERTVHFYAQWLARHKGSHLKLLPRMLAALLE
jgi:hypothetical protein